MRLILSKHVVDEMASRGIRLEMIRVAINMPDRRTPDPFDANLTRFYSAVAELGGRVLRAVHRPQDADIFVVTAHWDRGARR